MAFTATDLTNIETAIMDIVSGKRVVATEFGGQRREFQRTDLNKLMDLRNMIQADVNANSTSGGILRRVSFVDES